MAAPSPDDEAATLASLEAAWMARLHIPRAQVPRKLGDMVVDDALLDAYAGHEYLLRARAKHPAQCRQSWDEMRMCILKRVDRATCERISEAYAPCAKELERVRSARLLALEEQRRRALAAAKAREAGGAPPAR